MQKLPANAYQRRGRDPLLGKITTTRKNPHGAISQLKTQRSYRQAKKIIGRLRGFRLEGLFYGNTVSATWDEVLDPPQLPLSVDWIQEFGWLAHAFKAHASELNSFLRQRREFGSAYLLGDYTTAEAVLDKIKNEHGCSFWLSERQFMVRQAVGGFEVHKQLLAEMQNEITDPLVSYIVTALSNRLEPHVNHESFRSLTQQMLGDLREEGHEWLSSIIEIQISPWTHEWISQAHEMLHWCSERPLIDRYDRSIKILAYMSCTELDEDQRREIASIIHDLRHEINDHQLTHIYWAITDSVTEPTLYPVPIIDANSQRYLEALDEFLSGRFKECVTLTESLLKQDPTSFDYYWLLARAAACCQERYQPDLAEASFALDILKNIQAVAENHGDIEIPLLALLTLALKLGDNHLGISLWQFAEREYSGNLSKHACRYASIQSKIHSPEQAIDIDEAYQSRCIEAIQRDYPDHLSVEYSVFLNRSNSAISVPTGLTKSFENLAYAHIANNEERYSDVLSYVEPILKGTLGNKNEMQFISQYAVPLQFDALIGLDQPEEAAAAILEHYTNNKNLLRHVPFEQLIEGAESGKWDDLRKQAYWPVLVFLNNGDEQDVYEAIDDFLNTYECTSPLQIIDDEIRCPPSALRILLRDVLVPRVLERGAMWAKTQEDRRKLRTKFLQALYSLSVEDQAFIVNELSELDQARILEEAYKNVEGPKFSVEYKDLNKSIVTLLEIPYERYCSFRDYEEKGGQLAAETELLALAKMGASIKSVDEKRGETSEFILQRLSTFVFGQYLFHPDKGINATLRTRIIHGALENQLKRVLEAHSLLATKSEDGDYLVNKSVLERISDCDNDVQENIRQAYIKFTETITSIYESLITSKFRLRIPPEAVSTIEQPGFSIKDLVSDQGLLDFSELFSESTFTRLRAAQYLSVSGFVAELHGIFLAQANKSLKVVQQYIGDDLTRQISDAIVTLNTTIAKTLDDGPQRATLRADIMAAQGEIVQDIALIQKWFSAATQVNTGIGSITELMATVGRVVNFASNAKLGKLIKGHVKDDKLEIDAALALYEVLSILLRNVVQHSGVSTGQEIKYNFVIDTEGRKTLSLVNKVNSQHACTEAVRKAKRSISKPSDPRVLDRSPGGTGLGRIRALLAPHTSNVVELEVRHGKRRDQFLIEVTY